MAEDRLITIAIHTYEKATILKSILENEGIQVALHNVNLVQPVVSSGVRVRIHESDLPKALRIIESSDVFCADAPVAKSSPLEKQPTVLVPVDFSEHSWQACSVAFHFAKTYGADVVVLHSFISPSIGSSYQLSNALDFDDEVVAEEEATLTIEDASQKQLNAFAQKIRDAIKGGSLPAVRFTTRLVDDLPEEAINDCAREIEPKLIVMGTRGAGKKERDLIGSVTAEVLDTCRYPVFTIPDGMEHYTDPPKDCHVVFFCNYEQPDLLALDLFYHLFPTSSFSVTLMNVPTKKMPIDIDRLSRGLKEYCENHLKRFTFMVKTVELNDMEAEFEQIAHSDRIDFIAVPNKRRNIFSRLFNPGLAHRLLFHADIPMIVLPV